MTNEDLFLLLAIVFAVTVTMFLIWSNILEPKNCERYVDSTICQAAKDKALSEGYGATGQGSGGFAVTKEKFPECFQLVCT